MNSESPDVSGFKNIQNLRERVFADEFGDEGSDNSFDSRGESFAAGGGFHRNEEPISISFRNNILDQCNDNYMK